MKDRSDENSKRDTGIELTSFYPFSVLLNMFTSYSSVP